MYSRKDGISIPKNYNGVRFRSSDEPMPMKEHRPLYRQEVKTAHSPLYDIEKTDIPPTVSEESCFRTSDSPIENNYSDSYLNDTANEAECDASENTSLNGTENEAEYCSLLNSFKLPVSGILNLINREDALLLGLILLLASEQNSDNTLILTFLLLLLLNK